ncbi:NAC domain superfamily [Arabidopsis suecica]|uniref:NAC domain superfamily n=1 Tax=Arabidopsis suecica TaxID=45249 RepID=A0A8T1ZFV8_ARASU|nr:NAC domain superfamily [Arabidopsis suecica]
MEQKPGFGFRPTDEELISYYLKNKILGNTWLVDDTINEINILNHHPSSFSSLSKIKSNDRVYYFFARKQYKTATKRKRSIKSWKWKVGGLVTKIKDESGNKIGKKRGILFDDLDAPKAKGEKSSWVIHEYQITSLPHPNLDSYVLYKIFDNNSKKKADISNGNSSSDPSQSLVSDMNTIGVTTSIQPDVVEQPGHENLYGLSENDLILPMNQQGDPAMSFSENNNNNDNPNMQLLTPYLLQEDDEFLCGLPPTYRGTAQHLLSDQEMQEKYIDTAPELEQPGQENVYGLSMNDLSVPINEQEDLFHQDAFDPETLFSDYNHPNMQLQTPNNDEYWSGLLDYNGGNFEDVFSDQEFIMQENRNDYRPKKSLSGIIADYSSDSDRDAVSISATSYKGTSSPGDSVGSSNRHFLQNFGGEILSLSKDTQTSDEPFISRKTRESQLARCTIPSKPEVTQGMVKTEKKGLLITQEATERKRDSPPYIYLINMIIGFILLLALINNIILV